MKFKKIICFIVVASLPFASCKKFLDQTPISTATDAGAWQTESDANTGVSACYALLRAALNTSITYYSYGDLISGEFSSADDASYQNVINVNWGVGIPTTNTYDPLLKLRLYTPFYTAITQANRCLYFINSIPASAFAGTNETEQQATKNRYMGEAYFIRAFTYFYICRVWGDVPLTLDNSDTNTQQQLTRSPQAVVLQQAITDATKASQVLNLRDNASSDRVVRADRGAANALLAHIYAWKGDYSNCRSACDAIINSNVYGLTDASNYANIYKGQSLESIFEIAQNSLSESQRTNDAYTFPGATLAQPYISTRTIPLWHINYGLVAQLYSDTNDVRYRKNFVRINSGSSNFNLCIKYTNIQSVNNNPAYQVSLNNIVIFRLADIQLLKAEALTATGSNAAALTIVNNIRTQRGAAPLSGLTGKDVTNAVFDERGRELFLEGHRTFDLIRLERITGDQQFDNVSPTEFKAGKYYWPLDPTLFITNAKLTQTAFWTGKVN